MTRRTLQITHDKVENRDPPHDNGTASIQQVVVVYDKTHVAKQRLNKSLCNNYLQIANI